MFKLTQCQAQFAVDELEKAIIEARVSNSVEAQLYVILLKKEMVELLVSVKS